MAGVEFADVITGVDNTVLKEKLTKTVAKGVNALTNYAKETMHCKKYNRTKQSSRNISGYK